MRARRYRFDDGGEVDALEEANKLAPIDVESGPKAEPEKPKSFAQAFREARASGDKTFMWQGKKYGTEMASAKSSAAVSEATAPAASKPRAKSVTEQMADRAASDTAKARSASEARAAKAREAESEMSRESRGKNVYRRAPQISTEDLDPNTLLPSRGYAKGGSVSSASKRGDGCAARGKTKGTMVKMMGGGRC